MTAASGGETPRKRGEEEQREVLTGQPSLPAAGIVSTWCWQTQPKGERIASGRMGEPLVIESMRRRHSMHGDRGRPLTWATPAQGRIDVSVLIRKRLDSPC